MSPRNDKPIADLFSSLPTAMPSRIRVGIGGWTYVPWRGGMFYPAGLVQRRELEYASRQLTSIEVNGTYYGAQKPATYAKWRDETPDGFVFSAKAPQRIMESKALSKTGQQIEDFVGGIVELGDKLGPLVWQFDKGKRIDAAEFEAFVGLLPAEHAGRAYHERVHGKRPATTRRIVSKKAASMPMRKMNVDLKDVYGLLRVPVSATTDKIRKSYREVSLLYHPDKNP